MKKYTILFICIVSFVILMLTNVTPNGYINKGDTYNKFLFIPEKCVNFSISFRSPYSGSLRLVDENRKPLSSSEYSIKVNGVASGPSFRGNGTKSVNVSIRCASNLRAGRKYIQVEGGGPYVTHIYFTHHMNPLLCWLTYLLMLSSLISFVWFTFLRRIVYPHFKNFTKTLIIPGQAPLVIKARGERMVVISSVKKVQPLWDIIIRGKILYKQHPFFETEIQMLPRRKDRILVKTDYSKYKVFPNPMPRVGAAELITNDTNKTKITIQ